MVFNDVGLQVVPGRRQSIDRQRVEDHPKTEPKIELEEKQV